MKHSLILKLTLILISFLWPWALRLETKTKNNKNLLIRILNEIMSGFVECGWVCWIRSCQQRRTRVIVRFFPFLTVAFVKKWKTVRSIMFRILEKPHFWSFSVLNWVQDSKFTLRSSLKAVCCWMKRKSKLIKLYMLKKVKLDDWIVLYEVEILICIQKWVECNAIVSKWSNIKSHNRILWRSWWIRSY